MSVNIFFRSGLGFSAFIIIFVNFKASSAFSARIKVLKKALKSKFLSKSLLFSIKCIIFDATNYTLKTMDI